MTDKNPTRYHLSASAINALKACPTRFRLAYREGLRLDKDTEARRMGTNWHALHEAYNKALREAFEECVTYAPDPELQEELKQEAYAAAIDHLNDCYSEVPSWVEPEDWDIERMILLTSFHVYLWYYTNDPIESLGEEIAFDLPIHEPRTGMPMPIDEVIRVGKIDTLVKWQNLIGPREMKSTSKSIGPDSDYWERSKKDTQVSMYALALRDLIESGQLNLDLPDGYKVGNTLYDVWKKPKHKPSKLSQKDTAEFLKTSKYYDQEFVMTQTWEDYEVVKNEGKKSEKRETKKKLIGLNIEGQDVPFTIGKSGEASIDRETPRMFAARLMAIMVETPEEYFVRKEIARSDADLKRFRVELYRIYQAMRSYERNNAWFENENQCTATFKCQYIPVCYGDGADKVCENNLTPPEFKRIYNVTVEGADLGDQQD